MPGVALLVALSGCAAAPDEPDGIASLFASDEQKAALAQCLEDRGWSTTYDAASGAVVTEVPDDQQSAFEKDQAECGELSGASRDEPLTHEQFDLVFEWYERIGVCLEDNGWDVPPAPSRATFEDTYDSDPWIPWILIPGGEMSVAREACPDLTFGGRAG